MAVLPFSQQNVQVAPDPQDDPAKNIKITVDDDGTTELTIGATALSRRTSPRSKKSTFDRNLAEDLDEISLQTLASYLLESIDADDQERSEWEETVNRAADYLGVKLKDPQTEVAGDGSVSQAVATCLMEAAVKLWGTAYAEQLPVSGPVKVERVEVPMADAAALSEPAMGGLGGAAGMAGGLPSSQPTPGQSQAEDDIAQALEADMNWYLTVGDRGYYPDHSKMLMNRNLIGIAFKEGFTCPIERKPLLRWVMAQDCIIAGSPTHLEAARRYTIRKRVSRSTMRRMQARGIYLDVQLVQPTGQSNRTEIVISETEGISATATLPRDYEHVIYQCHCELGSVMTEDMVGDLSSLDLDENGKDPGYPLPYKVVIDVDSRQILAIHRDWKKGDEDHKRRKRMVKYGFLPAFGSGFYDWGLLQIAGNPTQAATMLQRAGVDASLFANFPAFAMKQSPSSKLETTVFRPSVGEVVKIPTAGNDKITDALMQWPYRDPSPQSLQLQQQLAGEVKALAGVVEIPVGEGRVGNTPVGTIMSYIESVSMVPGAVHKQDHISQAEEFELLRDLIAEEPSVLTRGNKTPQRKWQIAEELTSRDISPRSDPNTPSHVHRLMKVQGDIVLSGLPQFQGIANNRKIFREAVRVLHGEDAAEYELPPQQPAQAGPDPKIAVAQIKAETEREKAQAKQQEAQLEHAGRMQELAVESADKAADRQAANQRERMKADAQHTKTGADMVSDAVGHAQDAQSAAQQQAHEAGMAAQQHQHEAAQQFTAPLTGDQANGG